MWNVIVINMVKTKVKLNFGILKKVIHLVFGRCLLIQKKSAETFVLNVARDYEAGIELKRTSEALNTIGNTYPEINLAKVMDMDLIADNSLPFDVFVARNEWIENAFEIHKRHYKTNGNEELLLVERFLADSDTPTNITSVVGRVFSQKEAEQITNDIEEFLTKAASCLFEKPTLNINDGDVVWDGEKAIIVAIS